MGNKSFLFSLLRDGPYGEWRPNENGRVAFPEPWSLVSEEPFHNKDSIISSVLLLVFSDLYHLRT